MVHGPSMDGMDRRTLISLRSEPLVGAVGTADLPGRHWVTGVAGRGVALAGWTGSRFSVYVVYGAVFQYRYDGPVSVPI